MSDKTTVHSGGIGFFGLLTIVLIVLKLTGHIDWSWWWVFSPMIFSVCLGLAILGFVLGIFALVAIWGRKR